MPYIITEPCVGTCDTSCVEVCPVDCIHGPISVEEIKDLQAAGQTDKLQGIQLYIEPGVCIDCGVCMVECPVEAIFEEEDVPEEWSSFIQVNYDHFR